jgi:heme/copper-type cytochrome/quinol oxidase subunit 3
MSVAVVSGEVRTRPSGWWGMWLLIATEAALFGVFVASYFYLRFRTQPWPPEGVAKPSPWWPLLATAVLVLSSLPMWSAARAAREGRRGRALGGLGVATLLAGTYLAVTAAVLIQSEREFGPSRDAYASIYYLLNGAHAAHVAAGVLVNLFLLLRLGLARTRYRAIGVEVMALYWHFVNALAVVVLLTTLSPLL